MLKTFTEEYEQIKRDNAYQTKEKTNIQKMKFIAETNHLIMWGCGDGGLHFIDFANTAHIPIAGVCDSNKIGEIFAGHTVQSPMAIVEKYPDAYFLISTMRFSFYMEIADALTKMGIQKDHILSYSSFLSILLPPISIEQFEHDYLAGYQWAYDFFQEEMSKQIILDRISVNLYRKPLVVSSTSPQYFEQGIITLEENEVFVDGGGYTGDTIREFRQQMQQVNAKYKRIHTFEPDQNNVEMIKQELKNCSDISIVPKGLWNCTTNLEFLSTNISTGSHFLEALKTFHKIESNTLIPVTSLDQYFEKFPEDDWPTFIKMDIEGSEKEALIGSEKIIRCKQPKLAICVYHKPADIYELPRLISQYEPKYQMFLRHYEMGYYETVLYAVPRYC